MIFITKRNIHEIHRLNKVLGTWNVKGHMLIRYVPVGTTEDNFADFTKDDLYRELIKLRDHMSVPVVSCDPVIKQLLFQQGTCGAGYYAASICADGKVKICDALPHYIGNIRETKIGNILEGSKFIHDIVIRNQGIRMNPANLNRSEFGCLAYQFIGSGNLDSPDCFHPNASCERPPSTMHLVQKSEVPFVRAK